MQIRQEVKIGLLVVVAMALFFWGFNFLKGKNVFVFGSDYYGVYNQIDGLTEGNPVLYKGYKIGTVQRIVFQPSEAPFLVTFLITEDIRFPENTMAQIHSMDIMGTKAVEIIFGDSQVMLEPGDTLTTGVASDFMDQMSLELRPLREKTERMISSLDSVLSGINSIFTDELDNAFLNLYMTIDNFQKTSANISQSFKEEGHIGKSLSNVEIITEDLRQTMDHISGFGEQLNNMNLQHLTASADTLLTGISDLIAQASEGKGTLGMLMDDPELYLNMADAAANMDRLLMDLRHNPDRYLHFSAINFGRKITITPEEKLAQEKGIVFKVKVAESKEPLDLKNKVLEDGLHIFEDSDGRKYIYTVGETSLYEEAVMLKEKLSEQFPDAEIISLKNGKSIRLNRALRQIRQQ